MTTQQLIAFIQRKVQGYTASDILLLINDVHNFILSKPNYLKQYIDPSTGMPPFISTTRDQYEYELPANAQILLQVFSGDLTGYEQKNYNYPISRYRFGEDEYYVVPTHKYPAYGTNKARVIFIDNPPTQSDRYYALYTLRPTQISSASIQPDLPSEFHLDLRRGVLALIRDEKYGDKSDWIYFETVTVPKIQDRLNSMCRAKGGSTPIQPEYKDYPIRYDYR